MTTYKNSLTEAELLSEWQEIQTAQQNPARFRVLYDRYYEPIFRFIHNRTADEETAADLCSQVFLKAMQNLNKFTYKGVPFSAWLYRIATNEITQLFRQQNRNRVVVLEDFHTKELANEIDDKAGLEINMQKLSNVIQQLDPDEVTMVQLRYFEQMAFKEVGEIMNITENNAKVKMYRLLQKMKKLF